MTTKKDSRVGDWANHDQGRADGCASDQAGGPRTAALPVGDHRPPYLRGNLKGQGVPEKGYTKTVTGQGTDVTDTVDAQKVYELFGAGATIVWSSSAPGPTCVAFLTPAGKQGFSPHHDPVDLFIVQTEGTKRWRLWNPPPYD
ncbi:JmjC domain-containing protein [Streptomyces sp. NPDC092370]|uniref:JmjC domain-containing protein n=1 Tax=Streptomyces sp. NPDC092370 TaxID=3366016 RepID=UPI0038233A5A